MQTLLFLYFLSSTCEFLRLKILFFSFHPYLIVSFFTFFVFFLLHRIYFDREFLRVALGCFCSLLLSTIFGENILAGYGLSLLFLFKFFVFFILPSNFFRSYSPQAIYRLYYSCFSLVGLFACAQVFCSFFDLYLPGTTQRIGSLARGQAYFYEPSYYALYATPFAVFETVRYLLTKKNLFSFLCSNLFLLISTSTGCFFSYLALFLILGTFKFFHLLTKVSIFKTFVIFTSGLTFLGSLFWILHPELLSHGLLKYFGSELLESSFRPRWEGIKQFWSYFLENPFLGIGLGGASTYIARKHNLDFSQSDPDLLSSDCAMNVTTEILGSLGMIGSFAFLCFFIVLLRRCRSVLRLPLHDQERTFLIAAIASLLVLFFTLQFNQSIMRSYVWLHVGLCVGYFNFLLRTHSTRETNEAKSAYNLDRSNNQLQLERPSCRNHSHRTSS